MASKKSIVSLNLGSQSVSFAQFHSTAEGGLVLERFQRTELLADPALESTRNAQIGFALSEFIQALGKKHSPASYALSGQSVFARFVKLPSVSANKVDQMIGFEAQQNVPFPIDEVVWDYQLISASQTEDVEVVLVAIKADLLDALNEVVVEAGFRPQVIDVAPMALYNAFRYNYSDLDGCSLLIDMGARTTNLIFVEGNRIFSRSLPIGGATITSAIAKEFGSSFADAEARKVRTGFVSLGGSYADAEDPDVAMVSKLIRNTMTRLHAEIGRSIQFYRTNQAGGEVRHVFVSGGNCGLPYLKEFFQEKLQLPIEYFNPLRNVAVSNSLRIEDVVKEAHVMGEVVGLALRNANSCPMELNLRPASVVRSQKLARKRPVLVAAAVCLVLSLAGWWIYFKNTKRVQEAFLAELDAKTAQMANIERGVKRVAKEVDALEKRSAPLVLAIHDRDYWVKVINELNAKLPPQYLWITELQPTSGGRVVPLASPQFGTTAGGGSGSSTVSNPAASSGQPVIIDGIRVRGLYLYNDERKEGVIVDYVTQLASSNIFDIDPAKQAEVISRSTSMNNAEWAFDYELQLKLRNPIAFQ